MGDINYKPLIDDMVWSYSRVEIFEDCPYRWFLTYIHEPKLDKEKKFYAEYGLLMHNILERYYTGEIDKQGALIMYLTEYYSRTDVAGKPKSETLQKYFQVGKEYLENLNPLPFMMVAVENRLRFDINGIPFVGVIDYLGMTEAGEYVVVDNKSRDLKPRSNRAKPTVKDKELDKMLRQLYIYAHAIKQIYGKFPKYLAFNCFKNGNLIVEEFNEDVYNDTIKWVTETIKDISEADDFYPNREYFQCYYLCGFSEDCEYDQDARMNSKRGD